MKSFMIDLYHGLQNSLERVARERLRQELMSYSDRRLLDMGFSPEKLYRGIAAWPWRIETVGKEDNVTPFKFKIEEATAKDQSETGNLAA